jgi:hypothetical protein
MGALTEDCVRDAVTINRAEAREENRERLREGLQGLGQLGVTGQSSETINA